MTCMRDPAFADSHRGVVGARQLLLPREYHVLHSLVRRGQWLACRHAEGTELLQRPADLAAGPVTDAGTLRTFWVTHTSLAAA
jgi:hypothetical protein